MKMKPEDKETLRRERAAYQETRRSRNEIQELRTQVQELGGTVVTQNPPPTDTISVSQRSQVSQLSTSNTSIMGDVTSKPTYANNGEQLSSVLSIMFVKPHQCTMHGRILPSIQ
jgi:hypothetical protein